MIETINLTVKAARQDHKIRILIMPRERVGLVVIENAPCEPHSFDEPLIHDAVERAMKERYPASHVTYAERSWTLDAMEASRVFRVRR